MNKREISVCHQTWALLCKNLLKKWRMKRESLLEWLSSLLLLLFLYLYPNSHEVNDFSSLPATDLGRVDSFSGPWFTIAYTPFTNTTQQIMNKVASASFIKDIEIKGLPDEESIQQLTTYYAGEIVRVIFTNTFSYHLKFMLGRRIPTTKEYRDHTAPCYASGENDTYCGVTQFWKKGFVALQAAINAAIIETTTNHSVMDELMSVTGKNMKIHPFISQEGALLGIALCLFHLHYGHFLGAYCKICPGCHSDWLHDNLHPLSPLWIVFDSFGFPHERLDQEIFLRGPGRVPTHYLLGEPGIHSVVQAPSCILGVDLKCFQPLCLHAWDGPDEYGRRLSPLFFLKSSFWSRRQKADRVTFEDEIDVDPSSNDAFEPVSPEFHGKEAIRIRNVTKEYKGKSDIIEALKDLALDIYEGQITAILGHSGAGKSTLLNILSGLSVPTKGSVTVYNNQLSEMADLENISRLTGVCPQSNVQFDFLTVRENLRLFAKIKGIQPQDVEEEIQRVLLELDMKNIQDTLAQNLSGGQKRKLTFGIAILGDPQIFLLDEPTAGLDPFSRHRVWSFLKERKADRVILFSTQFMDEADILADRKVFLSKGKLKCAGSSLFLKKKWGIGYHLSLQLNEMCVQEKITSLVKQHIPDAKLSAESEGKLVYTLPLERTNRFPELYEDLDHRPDLGIENYGVSMTTLNEVFLKLEGKSTIDEPDVSILGEISAERAGGTENLVEMEQVLSSLNEMREIVGGMALWRQQVCAIARVRFLKLKHERKALLSLLLVLGIGFLPVLLEYIILKIYQSSYTWELSPHIYFLAPGQQPHDPLTQLLIINKTGASIDDFIHSVEHQNIALEVDAFGTRSGLDEPSYNGAIIVSGHKKNYSFSLACNTKRLNCFPVLMDIVSNGLLGMVKPSARIQTDRSTYLEEDNNPFDLLVPAIFWLILASSCAPYIAMSSVDDYKNKAWSQLRISGLFPSAYWFGQALVDVPMYWLIFLFMYLLDYLLTLQDSLFKSINQMMQIPCAIGYAISLILFTYIISFIFRKGRKNSGIWSFCFFIITLFCVVLFVVDTYSSLFIITFLIPHTTLLGCVFIYFHLFMFPLFNGEPAGTESFLVFLIPFLHCIIFVFILRCLEWKFGKKSMRKDPLFRISPRNSDVCPNPEEPEEEDEDVRMERLRTANALSSTNFDEKPVIIASCLRKEYMGKRKHCFSKRKKKIATRNVSFCVRKGEVLGLLGHNGAGKSTSIKVITGDTKPTAGQVQLKGSSEGAPLGFLGYCPQENALWPNLTVREHLEVLAAVKGLRKVDTEVAISRLVDALKLQAEQKRPVKALSEGIKRKLCFALSILGNPSVVLLDEPSTGMDPEGQLQMWQAIRATFKNTERGALLTTHYMAEAEAVCDRVAIMVSGRLRCIGSIQHLKSKFGKDYLLEMKVKTPTQVEPLHTEILRLFPQAARQNRYSSLMVYKLPVEDVQPLAQAFFKLERVKQSFDLEEYSLSQSTLEQVFLELSKEQELDDFDEHVDLSMQWKLLPHEEP
ncbi:ABC-type organic anion transporter ABCA8 isoform 5-T6 [Hipposideros larvatus]